MVSVSTTALTHWPLAYLNFIRVIFKIISVVDGCGISCETVVRWMSLFLSDDKPLPDPILTPDLCPLCVTRPQCANSGGKNWNCTRSCKNYMKCLLVIEYDIMISLSPLTHFACCFLIPQRRSYFYHFPLFALFFVSSPGGHVCVSNSYHWSYCNCWQTLFRNLP